jgi:hypothetical protein
MMLTTITKHLSKRGNQVILDFMHPEFPSITLAFPDMVMPVGEGWFQIDYRDKYHVERCECVRLAALSRVKLITSELRP